MSGTTVKRRLRIWGSTLLAILALIVVEVLDRDRKPDQSRGDGGELVAEAQREHRSNLEVEVFGVVERVLPNDEKGARHQRFVLELASGQTLLVAHNIDLAQEVPLRVGDRIRARGEYEWSERGGVLHWTHHDPSGRHEGGWIESAGRRYQ